MELDIPQIVVEKKILETVWTSDLGYKSAAEQKRDVTD